MKGVFDLYNLPKGQPLVKGDVIISSFEFKNANDPLYNLRSIRDSGGLTMMEDGKYVRLVIGDEVVMSDTKMEKDTNYDFCQAANGKVLVAGLGLGLVIYNLTDAFATGRVKEVTIIGKSKDVIDLVGPYISHLPIKTLHADIFNWVPRKGEKFDTIYFDIWSRISTDNLNDIKKLHNKYKFHLNRKNPDCWMNSWVKEWLQRERRRDR